MLFLEFVAIFGYLFVCLVAYQKQPIAPTIPFNIAYCCLFVVLSTTYLQEIVVIFIEV